jgi:hypothetical protein
MNTTNKSNFQKRKLFFFPLFLIAFFSLSAVVMLLWNWIIPSITTFGALTYWKAMGLLVLSKILFGGFQFKRHHHKMHQHFEQHAPFKDKFLEMTDEEKQQFKDQFKNRCCFKP